MAGYQVTPDELTAGAASCDATASNVAAALAQLRTYVVGTEEFWSGTASLSFQSLMATYDGNARQLHEALTEIAVRLRNSAANYGEGEKANLTNVTTIQQSLPAANLG